MHSRKVASYDSDIKRAKYCWNFFFFRWQFYRHCGEIKDGLTSIKWYYVCHGLCLYLMVLDYTDCTVM